MTNPNTAPSAAPIPRACGPDDHDCILATPAACKQRGCQSACRDAGGAARQGEAVAPEAMPVTIFNALDEAAQTILGEETRNNVREWLRRAWHHNVCPAIAASPQHQVKKGEPS